MMKQQVVTMIFLLFSFWGSAQNSTGSASKERLDFAKMYFELGGNFAPSFTGKRLINNEIISFENSMSLTQYLNWGAFHFWGHAEFYVTFPLGQTNFSQNEETDFTLTNYVVTGARYLPWAMTDNKIRPYLGASWGANDFQQKVMPEENQTVLTKEFLLVPETGIMYAYKSFMLRLGLSYYHDNVWNYPLSRTTFSEIQTPNFNFQLGINYSFDATRSKDPAINEEWNSYPTLSKLGYDRKTFGDFFVGIGPSLSFSLDKSIHNQIEFPYLRDQLNSTNYFDIAVGYQFNKLGLFTSLSFRNPTYKTEGFGVEQQIKKTSLTLEVNKFFKDYSGFAPFIGVNLAYDRLNYSHQLDGDQRELDFEGFEPGLSFGWDIVPGKTSEALILRTNLRWYPFSSFIIDGKRFDFSQLEYNLIQVVIYPDRLKRKKK